MIKNNICRAKPKENKYLNDIDMKLSDSTLEYKIEGYDSNNPFIRSSGTSSEDFKQNNNNNDIKKIKIVKK